jgi:basic amino acid/polyamine antiporter, APA family
LRACAVAAALSDVAATLFPPSVNRLVRGTVIVGVIGAIAVINIGGVARGARLVGGTTLLKLAPLTIFILVGASAFMPRTLC